MHGWRKQALCLLMLVLCFSLTGMVFGSWEAQQDTDDILTMSSYKAKIVEEYEEPSHVDPSDTVDKVVNVRNEGTVDILVRVFIEKMFGDRADDGTFRRDEALDTDVIEIDFDDTCWEQREDGWFYYRGVLKAGETTEQPLMRSYRLSERAGNPYKGKEARIIVRMESVQAEGGAAEAAWGTSVQDAGVRWADEPKTEDTGVTFLGRDEGFSVTADNTDLFASFKNLLPGCARTQKIVIGNQSSEDVEIFLHAKETDQVKMSKKQQALVREMLEKYAVITVREDDQVLYQGAVCGQSGQNSMRDEISLGMFPAGSSKNLVVSLALSPQMDNEFEKLTGKVNWVFAARGKDGESTERVMPLTGDFTDVGMWIALFAASGLSLWLALWAERKNRRKEQHEMSEMDH